MFVRLVVALFLIFSGPAFATVSPVPGYTYKASYSDGTVVPVEASPGAACADALMFRNGNGSPNGAPYASHWSMTLKGMTTQAPNTGQCLISGYRAEDNYSAEFDVSWTGTPVTGCPSNSTPSGSACQCNTNYTDGADGKSCTPPVSAKCTPGNIMSNGYFDTGTSPTAGPAVVVCNGGCSAVFDGNFPSGSTTVKGVKHYYAQGSYQMSGDTCNSGTGSGNVGGAGNAPLSVAGVPTDTCAAGDAMGQINGKSVCVTPVSGQLSAPTAAPPSSSQAQGTTTVTNSDGSKTTTVSILTTNSDGSTGTTNTAITTNADGSSGGVKITKSGSDASPGSSGSSSGSAAGSPTGSASGSASGSAAGSPSGTASSPSSGASAPSSGASAPSAAASGAANPCTSNPSATGCGGVAKAAGTSLYTAKGKTFKDTLSAASTALADTPIGRGVGGFFTVSGGGGCSPTSWEIPYLKASVQTVSLCSDFAANALHLLAACFLIVASFMAFRIAVD